MAIGDEAIGVGWDVVPETGEAGRIRWGAREINRTRDMAAQVYNMIPDSKTRWQKEGGIYIGTVSPETVTEAQGHGNLYFRVVGAGPSGLRVYMNWNGEWLSTASDPA